MVTAKYITVILLLFAGIFVTNAQQQNYSTDDKKAIKLYKSAEQSFILGHNEDAIQQLKKAIKRDDLFAEAWLMLGDINTEMENYKEASSSYQRALQISDQKFYFANYLIGNLEFKLGNYEDALNFYNNFLRSENISDQELKYTQLKIKTAKTAHQLQNNPLNISLRNMGNLINTEADEYINFVDEKTTSLYLTRKEPNLNFEIDGNPYAEKFYYTLLIENKWDFLRAFAMPVQDGYNTGAISFSIDRKQLYFTGCSWPESFGSCDLYYCIQRGKTWMPPVNLGASINTPSWDSQPVLSSDGKTLYFASKRGGGYGGSDIWKSEKLENGLWGKPVNLGKEINSPGNEMAPYIHADTKTLYFSSDHHPGLGGYDLFLSRINEDGNWGNADNLGVPINSKDNEINIFISIDASTTWISSDRDIGFGGYDIYEFKTAPSMSPDLVVYLIGKVINSSDKQPLNAIVTLTDIEKGKAVITLQSDPIDGSFFVPIYPGVNYAFNITSPGHIFLSENYNFKDSLKFSAIEKTFELKPLKPGNAMVLNNIFFDFDSHNLKSSSFPELDLLVNLLITNPELNVSINGHTDSMGSELYNESLSEKRAKAVYDYLVNNQVQANRLEYKGFGASKPVASNETDEGRAANRRTEVVIL